MASTPMNERRFARNPVISEQQVVDETMLFVSRPDGEDVSVYTLNAVGGRIWQLLDGQQAVGEIRDIIAREYQISTEQAEQDLHVFIENLQNVGAIQPVE